MTIENATTLQERMASEAIAMLSIHGKDIDVRQYEQSINLIAEAWNIPAESTMCHLTLISQEKTALSNAPKHEEANHVLPESKLPMNASGTETLDNIWGLFETSLRLGDEDKRQVLYHMARELEECQNLSDWIVKTEDEKKRNSLTAS